MYICLHIYIYILCLHVYTYNTGTYWCFEHSHVTTKSPSACTRARTVHFAYMHADVQKCTYMYADAQKCTYMYADVQKCTYMHADEHLIGLWARAVRYEPSLDGLALVHVSISQDHWVRHDLLLMCACNLVSDAEMRVYVWRCVCMYVLVGCTRLNQSETLRWARFPAYECMHVSCFCTVSTKCIYVQRAAHSCANHREFKVLLPKCRVLASHSLGARFT